MRFGKARLSLVLFSGPPGVGKSRLSYRLAHRSGWGILSKDQVDKTLQSLDSGDLPRIAAYRVMLDLAELNLRNGVSVILDAVFPMSEFRMEALRIAETWGARFCPVVCCCSNKAVWQERVADREERVVGWPPADWQEAQRVQAYYEPWTGAHLLLDATDAFEDNFKRLLDYLMDPPDTGKPL